MSQQALLKRLSPCFL